MHGVSWEEGKVRQAGRRAVRHKPNVYVGLDGPVDVQAGRGQTEGNRWAMESLIKGKAQYD